MRLKIPNCSLAFIAALAAAGCLSCSPSGGVKELPLSASATNSNHNQAEKLAAATLPGPTRPKILSRREWKAKEPVGRMAPHTSRRITIHHTATPQKQGIPLDQKMQRLQSFSQNKSRLASGGSKPAWPDVPYHYYIAVDGWIAEGRDLRYVGDTNTDYDPTGHALIVLEGNFEQERPSPSQLESLRDLVTWLAFDNGIPAAEIKGHSDYASTACPGSNLRDALSELRREVSEIVSTSDRR